MSFKNSVTGLVIGGSADRSEAELLSIPVVAAIVAIGSEAECGPVPIWIVWRISIVLLHSVLVVLLERIGLAEGVLLFAGKVFLEQMGGFLVDLVRDRLVRLQLLEIVDAAAFFHELRELVPLALFVHHPILSDLEYVLDALQSHHQYLFVVHVL